MRLLMNSDSIRVSAPGRICLFGEHQDYLGLDVIAAAIDLRITVAGTPRTDRTFIIDLPDLGTREEMLLSGELPYAHKRDYLRSVINVLRRQGTSIRRGWDVVVRGTIPINAGTSSSSALVVAWNKFLLETAGDPRAGVPGEIAELGFLTEVAEFREPGGKMDHYASAYGGVIRIEFDDPIRVTRYPAPPGEFVLGNSLEKKDTTGTLGSVKDRVLRGVRQLGEILPGFRLRSEWSPEIDRAIATLDPALRNLIRGTFANRDLTRKGVDLFRGAFDPAVFGGLLVRQQEILRENLGISTPKIDRMIDAALEAGALGAKINGSGGGGCMFAYAPGRASETAAAVEKAGGQAYIIRVDDGARLE
jgi:galactokinase